MSLEAFLKSVQLECEDREEEYTPDPNEGRKLAAAYAVFAKAETFKPGDIVEFHFDSRRLRKVSDEATKLSQHPLNRTGAFGCWCVA